MQDLQGINIALIIPKISTIISNLAAYKFFATLNVGSAYCEVHLPKELQHVSFTTHWGCFRNQRLCFGLIAAASTVQILMVIIFDEIKLPGCCLYLDDVVIAPNSFHEMTDLLQF